MDTREDDIKALEKQIRTLSKKLERSEADRRQLESASEQREGLLKGVIRDLETSQLALEPKP
jgi:two-component system NtrC family sensor kinase